jgi:hypothetical protein
MNNNSNFGISVLFIILSAIIGVTLFFLNASFVYGLKMYNEKSGYFVAIFLLFISGFIGTALTLWTIYNQLINFTKIKGILKILFILFPLLFINLIILYVGLIFCGMM